MRLPRGQGQQRVRSKCDRFIIDSDGQLSGQHLDDYIAVSLMLLEKSSLLESEQDHRYRPTAHDCKLPVTGYRCVRLGTKPRDRLPQIDSLYRGSQSFSWMGSKPGIFGHGRVG